MVCARLDVACDSGERDRDVRVADGGVQAVKLSACLAVMVSSGCRPRISGVIGIPLHGTKNTLIKSCNPANGEVIRVKARGGCLRGDSYPKCDRGVVVKITEKKPEKEKTPVGYQPEWQLVDTRQGAHDQRQLQDPHHPSRPATPSGTAGSRKSDVTRQPSRPARSPGGRRIAWPTPRAAPRRTSPP